MIHEIVTDWADNTEALDTADPSAVLKELERDLIGWSMTNSTKLVQPLWGGERMLGTNPISVAFPGNEEPPVVIDMATSAVAYGKVEIAKRKQEDIPPSWAVDSEGRNTITPDGMIELTFRGFRSRLFPIFRGSI